METSFQAAYRPIPLPKWGNCSPSTKCARRRMRACSEYEDPNIDPQMSRRVFNAGVLASAIGTCWVGYRIVVGDDLKSQMEKRLRGKFPSLFPKIITAEDRRGPIDINFCTAYYTSVAAVAAEMGIVAEIELKRLESEVEERAKNLFFATAPQFSQSLADPVWLNFLLYSRLHVIAERTSPRMRVQFSERLAERTLRQLPVQSLRHDAEWARANSDQWIESVRALLDSLVKVGWISGYRVSEFDGAPGSAWREEGRASLTVFAFDPLLIQSAQLIGEEEYEEISPKVSPWIKTFLHAAGISNVSMEDYYLDDEYRPDPADFKPSQLATEFDLSLN